MSSSALHAHRLADIPLSPTIGTDDERFRMIFDAQIGYVVQSLRRLGVREADLEDVAQEVFVAVYKHFPQYDATRPCRPWLFSFACRVAANHRKLARHRREIHHAHFEHVESDVPTPEERTGRRQDCDLVHKALLEIDFDRRVALIMHDLDGFAVPHIAQALNVPVNTVYSRVRLARQSLRDVIQTLRLQEHSHEHT